MAQCSYIEGLPFDHKFQFDILKISLGERNCFFPVVCPTGSQAVAFISWCPIETRKQYSDSGRNWDQAGREMELTIPGISKFPRKGQLPEADRNLENEFLETFRFI